jgi:hypothetical protein
MIELFGQVLQLEQQIFIWIGESPASLTELAVGIPSADSTASRYTASGICDATSSGLGGNPASFTELAVGISSSDSTASRYYTASSICECVDWGGIRHHSLNLLWEFLLLILQPQVTSTQPQQQQVFFRDQGESGLT